MPHKLQTTFDNTFITSNEVELVVLSFIALCFILFHCLRYVLDKQNCEKTGEVTNSTTSWDRVIVCALCTSPIIAIYGCVKFFMPVKWRKGI